MYEYNQQSAEMRNLEMSRQEHVGPTDDLAQIRQHPTDPPYVSQSYTPSPPPPPHTPLPRSPFQDANTTSKPYRHSTVELSTCYVVLCRDDDPLIILEKVDRINLSFHFSWTK